MNIKELMEWRQDCFFCRKDLVMRLVIKGSGERPFYIKDNILIIEDTLHGYPSLSLHIENGEILDLNQEKIMIDNFLKRHLLQFQFRCLSCTSNPKLYMYTGDISITSDNYINISSLEEFVYINNYVLHQNKTDKEQDGALYKYKVHRDYKNNSEVKTPFFDLKTINPKKLKHKLKTCMVFS